MWIARRAPTCTDVGKPGEGTRGPKAVEATRDPRAVEAAEARREDEVGRVPVIRHSDEIVGAGKTLGCDDSDAHGRRNSTLLYDLREDAFS